MVRYRIILTLAPTLAVYFDSEQSVIGQIMSLRSFGWVANCNIWLNMAFMIMTIYGVSHYKPVPQLSEHKHVGPIITSGWIPSYTKGWYQQVSGVQLAIFA